MSGSHSFTEIFQNRRTIHHFDPEVKISEEEVREIIEESTNAPSAFNLQPWRIIALQTPEGRAKVEECVWKPNKGFFEEAPVTLFLFADPEAHNVFREFHAERLENGEIDQAEYDRLMGLPLLPFYDNGTQELRDMTAVTGASLLMMSLLLNIRNHGYESIAWYGYDMDKVVAALDEDEERYIPFCAVTFGKQDMSKADQESDHSNRYSVDRITKFL